MGIDAYFPPSGFYFKVGIDRNIIDASFQEVDGISVDLDTESIEIGGVNNRTHKVPKKYNFSNLVLKRGLMLLDSPLTKWFFDTFDEGLNKKIVTKQIYVKILDPQDPSTVLSSWQFYNAYPVKWKISSLDAMKGEVVAETVELTYSYFKYTPLGE